LLSKKPKYYYDYDAVKEPSKTPGWEFRNKRSVWNITIKPQRGLHFATFPEDLVEPMILAGCPQGGIVLDPFFGSGTTGVVALKHRRRFVGMELNQAYIDYANERLSKYLKQKKLV
jgi:site-specific DNA-methyltransferase (cytosine-N4-specific)